MHAHFRAMTLFDLEQLDAHDREPSDIERITENFVVLVRHTAVGLVDADGPDLFAGLTQSEDDVRSIHAAGMIFGQRPDFIAERGNGVSLQLGALQLASLCHCFDPQWSWHFNEAA